MQLTACIPVWVLGVLVLVVEGTIPCVMTFLATKVASICPQSTYSQVLFPALYTHWIVIIITLIPSVTFLLRVISLLTLANSISLSFILSELLRMLGRITSLALRIRVLVLPRL